LVSRFDNIKQMLVGMIIGLIVTVVFAILELFSMGEYVFVALVLEVAIVSIYSLVRWFD
jgi:ABC-type bacteriocin/lantibiotic exporter with double-glycine peptidase domain